MLLSSISPSHLSSIRLGLTAGFLQDQKRYEEGPTCRTEGPCDPGPLRFPIFPVSARGTQRAFCLHHHHFQVAQKA